MLRFGLHLVSENNETSLPFATALLRVPYNSPVLIADPRMCKREPNCQTRLMAAPQVELSIDEYLRKRLMPVEGAIPLLAGIDMYGNSIPAGPVGGDLFEYINFQQRYNIDARPARLQ